MIFQYILEITGVVIWPVTLVLILVIIRRTGRRS
jgi:hypothetical protein